MNSRVVGVTVELENAIGVKVETSMTPWTNKVIPILSTQYTFSLPIGISVYFLLAETSKDTVGAVDVGIKPVEWKSTIIPQELSPSKIVSSFEAIASEVERGMRSGVEKASKRTTGIGRGGPRHQYIQMVIKKLAESVGYSAKIEVMIPEGSVDVVIYGKNNLRIACEVPVSSKYSEAGNLKKCIVNNFDYVVSVALERKTLDVVKNNVNEKLTETELEKVKFFLPEELVDFLKALKHPHSEATIIRGWKVFVKYNSVNPVSLKQKKDTINKILLNAMQKKKKAEAEAKK